MDDKNKICCSNCKHGAIFAKCPILKNNDDYQKAKEKDEGKFFSVETHKFKDSFKCELFNSRYVQYPIAVTDVITPKSIKFENSRTGKLVKIKPCGEEYKGKTYLGIYLGDMPQGTMISHTRERVLEISFMNNPAIYVFNLKKIVYGCESWWGEINSPDELKDITEDDIENTWYVRLLKNSLEPKELNTHMGIQRNETTMKYAGLDIDNEEGEEE